MSFGTKLSKIRTERNMSQEELAERLDVSTQTVYRWEHDKSAPNIHQVKTLCEVFTVKTDYFFAETESAEELAPTMEQDSIVVKKSFTETLGKKSEKIKIFFGSLLFLSKWYFWALYLPWLALAICAFDRGLSLIVLGPPCLTLLFLTTVQELLYRLKSRELKRFQWALSVIKNLILAGCACFYSHAATLGSLWGLIYASMVCMSVVACILEIIRVNDTCGNRNKNVSEQEKKTDGKKNILFVNKVYFWVCMLPWLIVIFKELSLRLVVMILLMIILTGLQEVTYRFKKSGIEKYQFALSSIKYLVLIGYSLYSFAYIPSYIKWFYIIAGCFSFVAALFEILIIKKMRKQENRNDN